jgi:uncharacterized membrane protein
MTTTLHNGTLTQKPRISSIDIMRGIVMVIMALDHTRDFFHIGALTGDPTNMETTTPALFFTRWITHYCAPTFVMLSGVGIRISEQHKNKKDLTIFLLTRGLWLIFLEVVVMRFSFFFQFYYDFTFFQVIWAIGASMIVMAALIHLPGNVVFALGLIIVFGHNIFDAFPVKQEEPGFQIWTFLRQSGAFEVASGKVFFVPYPLLPWLGIMLTGYGIGKWYTKAFSADRRYYLLLYSGAGAILLFIILRSINVYGDGAPWSVQKNFLFTVMSFLNTTKYPVSLIYTLMTLGPILVILALMEIVDMKALKVFNPFVIIGRVPLFYYILHFYLIHFSGLIVNLILTGKSWGDLDFHFNKSFGGITPGVGVSLPWTYVAWILIVLSLYPLCKWYNRYKSTHTQWWLSYL